MIAVLASLLFRAFTGVTITNLKELPSILLFYWESLIATKVPEREKARETLCGMSLIHCVSRSPFWLQTWERDRCQIVCWNPSQQRLSSSTFLQKKPSNSWEHIAINCTRVQNCPDITILNSHFCLCLFSFFPFLESTQVGRSCFSAGRGILDLLLKTALKVAHGLESWAKVDHYKI